MVKLRTPFVSFDCGAEGSPKPYLKWFLNDERLLLNDRIKVHKNGTLVIYNIQSEDVGEYRCVAENVNEKITTSAALEIMSKYFIILTLVYYPIY